jgi:membrane protease YdiL (CAAX protease family)
VKSTKAVKEAYTFLGLTLAFSYFVFWGPLALFRIPAISFVGDVRGPAWAMALFLVGGFVPSLLAVLLTWKKEGLSGLRQLGRRIIQFKLGWRWYVFTFLIVIAGTAGQLTINRLLGNTFNGYLFGAQLGSFLPLLIFGPLSEEIGWRGYALGRLQTRWNALTSSLIVGLIWALWHLPLFMMVGTSQQQLGVPFVGLLIKLMAISILLTWLYNNTKQSLWSAILLHWLYNWLECLPYAVMALVVVLIWKPQTLSKPQKMLSCTVMEAMPVMTFTNKKNKRLSIKPFERKVIGIMLTIPAVLLVCVFILAGVLLAGSPGRPEPFLDQDGSRLVGSISEKIFVNINGVEQGMFIKSKDATHPVLLYLHGGMPEYFLTQQYPTGLEDYFTAVWWEQRGSGISYGADIPPETMILEQMISDTLEVTNYLRHRFGQEKIYLMGHSGGTFIGIHCTPLT